MQRRNFLMLLSAALVAACTNGAIDPTALANAIKTACAIAVPAATLVALINASTGQTMAAIVAAVCSGYQSALAQQAASDKPKLAAGEAIDFVVVINGQEIPIHATKE